MGTSFGSAESNFGEKTDWKEWSQEMQDYCVLDVKVTTVSGSILRRAVVATVDKVRAQTC